MNLSAFELLTEEEQKMWSWDADESRREEIRQEFLRNYKHPKIKKVIVGGYGIGDVPCVYVEMREGKERVRLPKEFMQRIIVRRYLSTGKLVIG